MFTLQRESLAAIVGSFLTIHRQANLESLPFPDKPDALPRL
jgi:hypothetical protein